MIRRGNSERHDSMTAIRCPQCKLINNEDVRRCRRCGTSLSLKNTGKGFESKPLNFDRSVRHCAIPAIVIITILCIYGFYRHTQGAPKRTAEISATNESSMKSAPENRDIETVKKPNRDFIARLDRNNNSETLSPSEIGNQGDGVASFQSDPSIRPKRKYIDLVPASSR
jgi:hypothetical protein